MLYNGMASTTPLAALYFVALMTFGNYVLFNLLVAILVEGFQAEVRPRGRSSCLPFSFFPSHSGSFEGHREELIELCCADDTKSCLQENNLHCPACVVSPLTFFLSRSAPPLPTPVFLSHLSPHPRSFTQTRTPASHWRTHAHTGGTLWGVGVFDIGCRTQLVSFCCLVFIFYLQHQRTLALFLSLSPSPHLSDFTRADTSTCANVHAHPHRQIPFS